MLEGHQATAFLADPLALVMVLVISLVGGIVCIFGLGYMQEHEDHLRLAKSKQSRFFFFLLLFLGAMNGLCPLRQPHMGVLLLGNHHPVFLLPHQP